MHLSNFICIVSPYPGTGVYLDGWMSRIKTIDMIFGALQRYYIDFQPWFPAESEPEVVYADRHVIAYRINPWSEAHKKLAERLLQTAKFVYIHTLHQCEYMLEYFDPARMIVDIHGIVPEEEAMMGSIARSQLFGEIEEKILCDSLRCIVVTRAMEEHYLAKYPSASHPEYIHLPVFDYGSLNNVDQRIDDTLHRRRIQPKSRVIYAGGSQIWQRVDLMIDVIRLTSDLFDYQIFTHNISDFQEKLSRAGVSKDVLRGNASKSELARLYQDTSFGFALREDSVVNRVACPTKICDYCANMVVPILSFSEIGDFTSYGYEFLRLDDVLGSFIPNEESQRWMIRQNLQALGFMFDDFKSGAERVLRMALEHLL